MKRLINSFLKQFGLQLARSNGIPATYKLLRNTQYFASKFNLITNIEGDVVECGVGFGHTLLIICFTNLQQGERRRVWAFDSFEGFPEPSIEDASVRNPKKGEWKVITTSNLDDILFRRCGLPFSAKNTLRVTKGYFEDTLPSSDVQKIALLHLDVDLYGSYKVCLNELYHKVVSGGVILFDEYKQQNVQEVFPGAAKAIDEFFADKPETIEYDSIYDKYFTIKR
jgi:hypothetical protein